MIDVSEIELDFDFKFEFDNDTKERISYEKIPNEIEFMFNTGVIGTSTYKSDKNISYFSINLKGFLDFENIPENEMEIEKISPIYLNSGNSSGGYFYSNYQGFQFENKQVYFDILGCDNTKNDEVDGNRKGYTYLVLARFLDNKEHNSLQLRLDSFTESKNKQVTIWHNGSLTCGNKGAVKQKYVMEFVKRKYPELIKNNRIELGTLDNSKNIIWDDSTKNFIANCCKYAVIRDEFRVLYKANKGKFISSLGFKSFNY